MQKSEDGCVATPLGYEWGTQVKNRNFLIPVQTAGVRSANTSFLDIQNGAINNTCKLFYHCNRFVCVCVRNNGKQNFYAKTNKLMAVME